MAASTSPPFLSTYSSILLFFLSSAFLISAAPESALITNLPGFNGTFQSKHYSGYWLLPVFLVLASLLVFFFLYRVLYLGVCWKVCDCRWEPWEESLLLLRGVRRKPVRGPRGLVAQWRARLLQFRWLHLWAWYQLTCTCLPIWISCVFFFFGEFRFGNMHGRWILRYWGYACLCIKQYLMKIAV